MRGMRVHRMEGARHSATRWRGGCAPERLVRVFRIIIYTALLFQSLLVILFAFLLLGVTAQHMVHRHTDTTENRETNTQPHNTRVTTRRSTNIPRSCATSRTDLDTLGHVVTHEQNDRHKTTEMARSRKDHSLPAATAGSLYCGRRARWGIGEFSV